MNGLYPEVRRSVESSHNFETFIRQIVEKIEKDNLSIISVCCTSVSSSAANQVATPTAGRHRSVSVGELLRLHVYPLAEVRHLDVS